MRCLWLSRFLPFPQTAGDRIYTARLAAALAGAGAEVTFAGLAGEEAPPPPPLGLRWHLVPGPPRGQVAALASTLPLVAARHATPAYRAAIGDFARAGGPWDAVLLDQYGMGWAARYRPAFGPRPPVFVFIAHDHEESVTRLQALDPSASLPARLYLAQNHAKTRRLERRTARICDLVTTITDADAALFQANAPGLRTVVLTPGYDGPRIASREIGPATPRVALVLGSFRWSAKQANLRMLLDRADATLAAAGIELRVVGDMPDAFRRWLEGRYRSVRVTGRVEDPMPHLAAARLAVVAEPIGGGFKMKLLEYVFHRVPVVALAACAAGLPPAIRSAMLLHDGMDALLAGTVAAMDDLPRLNALQQRAYAAADGGFDWADRGRALLDAIRTVRSMAPAGHGTAEAGAAMPPRPVAALNRAVDA